MAKLLTGLAILDAPAYEIRSLDAYYRELRAIHNGAFARLRRAEGRGDPMDPIDFAKLERAAELAEQLDDHLREQGD